MTPGELGPLHFSLIGLILILLTMRTMTKLFGSIIKSLAAGLTFAKSHFSERFFENKRIPALKTCPNCAEQLPLSTLICESCDYNFLASSIVRGQKLLPAPNLRA
jgi:uncharacterized protein UPF0547